MPEQIIITSPVANDAFIKGSPIAINLSPDSSTQLNVNIFIDDYSVSKVMTSEVASFFMTPIHNHSDDSHVAGNRTKSLNFTRINSGTLASGFDGGSINAKQEISISLNFTD